MKKITLSEKGRTILRMILAVFTPTIMTLLLYFAASLTGKTIQMIHQLTGGGSAEEKVNMAVLFISSRPLLTTVLVYLASIPFVYVKCVRKMRKPAERESRINRYLLLLPLGAAVSYLCNILMGVVSTYFIQSESFLGESIYSGNVVIDLITIALLPAVMEEVIYRGTIHNGLKYFMNRWLAVIISAVIFGLMHQSPAQAIYAFMLGVLFAVVYEHYGNLLASILLHFAANVFSVLGTEWVPLKEMLSTESGSVCILVFSVVLVAVYTLIFVCGKRRAQITAIYEKEESSHC